MSDLQATFEFSVELYKFYNVDLFQRGMYQVRVGLRVSPKLPVQVEVMVGDVCGSAAGPGGVISGATLVGGLGASRIFQILYRNEEVTLRDVILFRAHLLVDSKNLKESLSRAEWSLGVELWCGEGVLAPVSCRVLRLHFQPQRGLHYHLPVLFDYFHLAAVSVTVHVALVALHQPYMNTPRSSKQWGKLVSKSANNGGNLENVLFGGSSAKCGGGNTSNRIAHARQVHAEVCGILLGSLEGLQNALVLCGSAGSTLTSNAESSNSLIGDVAQRMAQLSDLAKCGDSEEDFACSAAQDIARLCAEVTLQWAGLLRAVSGRPHAHHALAAVHHALRVKRFSECFFVLDNPRHSLAGCYDANYQSYQSVSDLARRSRYLALLPPLPIHCIALDGDPHIMPIIFEDRYQDTAEFARRRSGVLAPGATKSGSEPLLCTDTVSDDCSCGVVALLDSRRPSSEASKVSLSLPKSIADPHSSQQSVLQATLTLAPKKSHGGSPKRTTIIKQTVKESAAKKVKEEIKVTGNSRFIVHNNQISEIQIANPTKKSETFTPGSMQDSKVLSRYSASTLVDIGMDAQRSGRKKQIVKQDSDLSNGFRKAVTGANTLPARHSKSLDQLKVSPQAAVLAVQAPFSYTQPRLTTGPNQCPASYVPQKPTTLPRNLTISNLNNTRSGEFIPVFSSNLQQRSGSQTAPINYNHKGEEYRRNINEFREKYKNPCTRDMNFNSDHCRNVEYKPNNIVINNGASNNHTYPSYYVYNNQGNSSQHLQNFVYNPLDFQRGYHATSLPRPTLPPRNSYPPVSSKAQQPSEPAALSSKNIHRSNSTQVFYQKGLVETNTNSLRSNRELSARDDYHSKIPYNHSYNDCTPLCQNGSKYPSSSNVDSGIVINFREKSPLSSNNHSLGKSPPSAQGTPAVAKQKKTKSKDQTKLHQSAKDLTRLNSSKDSLSSHQSSRSRDSKTDKSTPRSEKRSASCGRHKASEKMSQQISEASTSSSNDSIPHALKRLESSSSVPFKLDQGSEGLRHCRSAASVLDEINVNSNIFSESLPNLAPPPAFDSPLLDITDEDFKILPPDTFKNMEDLKKRPGSGSTSSLSEQSGWVSSGRSSERSSPDAATTKPPLPNTSLSKPPVPNPPPKPNTDNLHTNTLQTKPTGQDKTAAQVTRTILNGEQLRERLLKLAIKVAKSQRESLECCCDTTPVPAYDMCSCCNTLPLINRNVTTNGNSAFPIKNTNIQDFASSSNRANGQYQQSSQKPMLGVRHNSFNAVDLVNTKNGVFINGIIKDTPIVKTLIDGDGLHPYIRKELPQKIVSKSQTPNNREQGSHNFTLKERIEYTDKLLAAEIRSLTMDRICKEARQSRKNPSDPNISQRGKNEKCKSEVDLSHITFSTPYDHLRLPPPQQFRDIPPPPDEFKDPPPPAPTLQLDNPLYHVYEGALERRQKRAGSIGANMTKSQSTGELAKHNQDGERDTSLASVVGLAESEQLFIKCREEFKRTVKYPGSLYSDFPPSEASLPYFHISDEYRMFNPEGCHLIVCVHGLDGNSADLRLVKTYLELGLPGAHLDFLMSERNQGDTFSDFDTMTDRLVQEILHHVEGLRVEPARISFVGHSLGAILVRSALSRPALRALLPRLHTFLSLSGPHLGTLYNSSGLVNAGMWFMQKWKRSGSLLQLSLRDTADPRQSFLCRLARRSALHRFRHVLLVGSGQDRYVPLHSARLELCKAAIRDQSVLGQAYREMVHNMISPLVARGTLTVARYDAQHALPNTANALIGRAAHIAALDSDLFIEKFLLVSALKYFR